MSIDFPEEESTALMPPTVTAKKEKGCFQCSRRRISCDRTEPSCLKCAKKGIECSGLGRIRFAEGVARRGHLKDCKVPKIAGNDDLQDLPTTTGFQAVRWPGEERVTKQGRGNVNGRTPDRTVPSSAQVSLNHPPDAKPISQALNVTLPDEENECEVEEIGRGQTLVTTTSTRDFNLAPWIAPIDPKLRMLFSYFSETVAPAMVVFDDASNGYRSVVLPMALEDDLLRRAVAVVAAQHLSRQRPELQKATEAGRAAVISRLHIDSLQQSADKVFNKFTWATLIVLLVGETVTGSADYRFFIQMLLSLSMSNPGRGLDPASSSFLRAQTHMFELLAVPLLGEEVGVPTLMRASESLMGFLSDSHLPKDCEDRRTADLIRQGFTLACNIYIRCAASADTVSRIHDTIQAQSIHQLIGIISQVPPSARGAHALVWVCFVAGAASSDQAQRDFFVDRLEQVYERTQFRNIPAAIESLENIWARGHGTRFTMCIPKLSNVLVM